MPKRPRESTGVQGLAELNDEATSIVAQPSAIDDGEHHTVKYAQVDATASTISRTMKCSLAPHIEVLSFDTFEDFEVHYAKAHANRCIECHKNFPTEHFLSIHLAENHDPINEARRVRGDKTFQCFVEGCERICSTPQKRRMHLIDKHSFPKGYDFRIVDTGIDKKSSMLRTRYGRSKTGHDARRPSKSSNDYPSEDKDSHHSPESRIGEDEESLPADSESRQEPSRADAADLDSITSGMSALKFIPPSIRFGRGGRRGFSR